MIDEELDEQQEQDLYEHHRITVDAGQQPLRIDRYLQMRLAGVSRNKIQAAADVNCIRVNDKPIKQSYKVKPLDVITILLPQPPEEHEVLPEPIPLNIVYEDEDVIVVDKPAGLVVHPAVGNWTGTLVNGLLYHLGEFGVRSSEFGVQSSESSELGVQSSESSELGVQSSELSGCGSINSELRSPNSELPRPLLVHRIDNDTSGLMVVTKNEKAQTALAKQFFDHTIERRYQALVWGDLDGDSGTITGNLGRSPQDRRTMCVYKDDDLLPPELQRGKHAVTHWRVLERFGYVTLVECVLETGRTHQIRAHMRHIGHPLFNDASYGGDAILKGTTFSRYRQFVENCFEVLPRQALHARILGFEHPTTGQHVHFESPLPPDFAACLDRWRSYTGAK